MGEFSSQRVAPEEHWREALQTQIDQLLVAPEAADVGLVKNVPSLVGGWEKVEVRRLHPPVRLPVDYQRSRHLWSDYVIDAAGINLLTDRHLARASDLSGWDIEEVAADRFLVSARDLAPWFAGRAAPGEVIDKARRDFGDMILSWDAILANPGPYTITDPIVGR